MLEITPVKAFNDNYLWLFRQPGSKECGIVDPGDASPVLAALSAEGLTLRAILITHHHGDHTGGIAALKGAFDVPVYGPDSLNIPAVTNPLREGDEIDLMGEHFSILEIPGHTMDHIAYVSRGQAPVLFCGDTLFAGGCGRVFEGTHGMMHQSLQKLAGLEAGTRVFCAHEYTMSNLAFAHAVTPDNEGLNARIAREQGKRDKDLPTVPTTIGEELATNPFLRCSAPEVIVAACAHSGRDLGKPEEVFAAIRSWKDGF
jgi:hydroxyacylglutathione hydrolase